jgi:SagB-type dehydrogenase family enzyme
VSSPEPAGPGPGVSLPAPEYTEYAKTYPAAPRTALPVPAETGMPLAEALRKRRSVRKYGDRPLTAAELGALCFAANGTTGELPGRATKTIPSAGALYPMELYVVVNAVDGVEPGLYHYDGGAHQLELMGIGDFREKAFRACYGQKWTMKAAVVFAMSAIFERSKRKYGERVSRYIPAESGHMSQNLYLMSTALNLGGVAIGAYKDAEWNALLGLDGTSESVIYLQVAGPLP